MDMVLVTLLAVLFNLLPDDVITTSSQLSKNTLFISVITTDQEEPLTQQVSPPAVLNSTGSLPNQVTNIVVRWIPLMKTSNFNLISLVKNFSMTSDIIFITEELRYLLPQDFAEWEVTWFPYRKGSSLCEAPMKYEPYREEFISCTSDEEMKNKETSLVVDIVKKLKWETVLIIYDKQTESSVNSIVHSLSSNDVQIWLYTDDKSVYTYNTYTGLYQVYQKRGGKNLNVVVLCSVDCTHRLIQEANEFDNHHGNTTALKLWSKWLIVQSNVNRTVIERKSLDIDNIAVVLDPRDRTCPKANIKQDLIKILHDVYEGSLTHNCSTLLTDVTQLKQHVLNIFNNTPSVSLSPTLSTLLWRTNTRELSEVITSDDLFPNYNFNFNNRMFVVSTKEMWPFIIKERHGNKTTYNGICYDLLKELSTSLNFSFQLIEPPDQEWGIMKDGRWTGLIGQLARSEVDLVVAAITVSNARETVMDFSFPYFYDSTGIFLKKPDAGLHKWYTLLSPFKWQVLLCISGVLVFTSGFLYLIERLNPFYERKNQIRKRFQLDGALWYLLGALLAHGGVHVPPTMASRVIIGCWWLFCIVSTATYSGNLIAFLTVTKDKLPFETLEGMLQQDTYKWGIMGGSVAETLFQNSSIDTYQQIWRKLLEFYRHDPDVLDPSETIHLQKVLQGDYAIMTDRSVLAAWSKYACNISLLPEKFFPNHYALGLPNNSPYLDMFTSQMIQIYESGLLQIWKQRWWPKTSYCAGSLQTHADAVDLLSLQSAFYIIAIGIFLALCVLVCEVIRVRYKCCIGGIH